MQKPLLIYLRKCRLCPKKFSRLLITSPLTLVVDVGFYVDFTTIFLQEEELR